MRWTGGINLPKDQKVTLTVPGGTVVRMHRATIIDQTTPSTVTVAMAAGFHPLTIETLVDGQSEEFEMTIEQSPILPDANR